MSKKKENIRGWIADLRSGDYAQAKHRLKRKNNAGNCSFCCLGVAIDRISPNSPQLAMMIHNASEFSIENMPSETFMERNYGLSEKQYGELAELNDSGLSFSEIADTIQGRFLK